MRRKGKLVFAMSYVKIAISLELKEVFIKKPQRCSQTIVLYEISAVLSSARQEFKTKPESNQNIADSDGGYL